MRNYYMIIHYFEPDWGDDIVRFYVPDKVNELELSSRIDDYRFKGYENYKDPQTYIEDILEKVAKEFGGEWHYLPQMEPLYVSEEEMDLTSQ